MVCSLPVVNLAEARFECIFGRGCDGICCQNGRPGVYPEEVERLDTNLSKFLPHLRPEAYEVIVKDGYLSRRTRGGQPMLRVVAGWCIFFHRGCVLHKVGADEGDKYRYKPAACALFPLARDEHDRWYVRQGGYKHERWDLFCLQPGACTPKAAKTIQEEIALAGFYADQEQQPAASSIPQSSA